MKKKNFSQVCSQQDGDTCEKEDKCDKSILNGSHMQLRNSYFKKK